MENKTAEEILHNHIKWVFASEKDRQSFLNAMQEYASQSAPKESQTFFNLIKASERMPEKEGIYIAKRLGELILVKAIKRSNGMIFSHPGSNGMIWKGYKEFEWIEETKSAPKHDTVMAQKCPVCDGKGIVPGGFYYSTNPEGSVSSVVHENCRQCNASGLIYPMSAPKERIEEMESIIKFLLGEDEYMGQHFGDNIGRAKYWWRTYLREAFKKFKTTQSGKGTDAN